MLSVFDPNLIFENNNQINNYINFQGDALFYIVKSEIYHVLLQFE